MPDHIAHALSFGQAAETYDRHRPSYPSAAAHWALGEPADPLRVVDLGAGTGILTRVLLSLGHDVVAVEPDAEMRARLAATTTGTTTSGTVALAGSAEHIPLPDDSVDAAVAGQAYHWFDPARVHAEIARVLRPGGCFAALWNVRDESEPWLARLSQIAHLADGSGREDTGLHDDWLHAAGFGPVSRAVFTHARTHTPDTLIELIKTRSYYLTSPPDRQADILAGIRELISSHPDLAGREVFELPYRTVVYRAALHRS